MVDAGIACPDDVIKKFKALQTGHNYHALIFKIEDQKRVVVDIALENTEENEWDWDVICDKACATGEPRFVVCDFHYEDKDNHAKTKLLFLSWTPESAKPGDKMLYAATKEGFKSKLDGVQKTIQATDEGELGHQEICARIDTL